MAMSKKDIAAALITAVSKYKGDDPILKDLRKWAEEDRAFTSRQLNLLWRWHVRGVLPSDVSRNMDEVKTVACVAWNKTKQGGKSTRCKNKVTGTVAQLAEWKSLCPRHR